PSIGPSFPICAVCKSSAANSSCRPAICADATCRASTKHFMGCPLGRNVGCPGDRRIEKGRRRSRAEQRTGPALQPTGLAGCGAGRGGAAEKSPNQLLGGTSDALAKLPLFGGRAILVALLRRRLRRLLGIVVMLCAAAAAAAVFLLPLDGETLWQKAQREGLPDEVRSEAVSAWNWVKDRVPGERTTRKRVRKGTEP